MKAVERQRNNHWISRVEKPMAWRVTQAPTRREWTPHLRIKSIINRMQLVDGSSEALHKDSKGLGINKLDSLRTQIPINGHRRDAGIDSGVTSHETLVAFQ